ncbi:COG1470 family protein [Methanosarcina horonobensis]|uniref:COG1470 family protein n=1 Tax=Methanosarcina horonobensis TaxID=418008 RepID=UPI000A9548B2|nr:hypothetical protein [Methanosarcina horonobensis]
MKYGFILSVALVFILTASCVPGIFATGTVSNSSTSSLRCSMEIPLDKNQAPYVLVAGSSWERARVSLENPGSEPLYNITVLIEIPEDLETGVSPQPYPISKEGQKIKAEIRDLAPGQSADLIFDVKPPISIEFKKQVVFTIHMDYPGGEQQSEQKVSLIPPPSWLTYFTILASLLLFIGILPR